MEQAKYDVFVSYSRKDYVDEHNVVIPGNEVSKIKEALTKAGITYWFDEEGIYIGDKFPEKIIESIENSRLFLFISSRNACESPWTSKEIACADEFGKFILPVRIDMTPYNKKIMFRIADLSYIDYGNDPEKGRKEVIRSIKVHLNEIKVKEEESLADEKRRKEELELQRKLQEEEKKRQEKIAKIETEIAALESQRTERQKVVLLKEQELKIAQVDLKDCENKIEKQQKKLQELREPQISEQKRMEEERKAAEKKSLEEEAKAKDRTFAVDSVEFKMIRVEGGSMGTFYIGETQVTQALWQAVMGYNPSQFKVLDHPVECVSWYEICGKDGKGTDPNGFLYKLNQKTGKNFRLPTGAEWEYAAKGGNKSKNYIYAGGDDIDKVAWYWRNSGDNYLKGSDDDRGWDTLRKNSCKTHLVKQLSPNELGIYDMSGNVWEWCEDLDNLSDSYRELRGGCWSSNARSCDVLNRIGGAPNLKSRHVGFRLVFPQ